MTNFFRSHRTRIYWLAYEFQFIKKLILEDFDLKLDVVFTDKQLL